MARGGEEGGGGAPGGQSRAPHDLLEVGLERLGGGRRLLRSILDNSHAVMFVKDRDGRYLLVNSLFERIFGLTAADIIGRTDHELFEPSFADRFRANDLATLRSGEVFVVEEVVRQTDGIHTYTSVKFPLRDEQGEAFGICGVASDISERKRAEDALRIHTDIVRNLHVGLYVWHLEDRERVESFRLVATNPAATRLTGVAMEDILGKTMPEAFPQVIEMGIAAIYREVIVSGRARDLGDVTYEDGRISKRIFTATLFPLPGDRIGVAFADVTAERRLEEQLRQAQKLEAVGRLAGGVAHDFNNLLTAILGYSDLCMRWLGPPHPLHHHLDGIRRAAERGAALVQQLLAVGRRQVLIPEPLDLGLVARELAGMLERLLAGHATLAIAVDPRGPWLAEVDRTQLERVIVNLVVNARDALPAGGRVSLEVGPAEPSEEAGPDLGAVSARESASLAPGGFVALRVRDRGRGMDAETRRRMFEPFFTTRESSGGTGLGLATVYGIVEQSRGRVHVVSAPGEGTTVTVLLPVAAPAPASGGGAAAGGAEPEGASASTPQGASSAQAVADAARTTVLLAEDDPLVRRLTREMLEAGGYAVIEATDGVEALAALERGGAGIDLLLTDIVMPHLGGRDLAERARASRPDLPVLFMSAYAGAPSQPQPLLPKPFTFRGLLAAVGEALGARSS